VLYKESLKQLNSIESDISPDLFMKLKVEKVFAVLLNNSKEEFSLRKGFIKKYLILLTHLYLVFISLLNMLFFSISSSKTTSAHFLININNSDKKYDKRSEIILKSISSKTTLNFFHCGNLRTAIKNSLFLKNAIYFESILFFINYGARKKKLLKDINSFWIEEGSQAKKEVDFLFKLLSFLQIKKFIFIDDSRNSLTLLAACKKLNIITVAYQHARFNEYHLGLKALCFDFYLVWNNYFKEMLLKLNPSYLAENILVCSHPRLSKRSSDFCLSTNTILFIEETYFDHKRAMSFMKKLDNNYSIIYRRKPGIEEQKNIDLDKVIYSSSESFEEDLNQFKPSVLVGSESTLLLESWLFNVPSIGIKTNNDYGDHLLNDGLIDFCYDPEDFVKKLKEIILMPKDKIIQHRDLIWSGSKTPKSYNKALETINFYEN